MLRRADTPLGLAHLFVPSLRFDREPVYRSMDVVRSTRWRELPVQQAESPGEAAAMSLALGRLLLTAATPVSFHSKPPTSMASPVDPAAVVAWAAQRAVPLRCTWLNADRVPHGPAPEAMHIACLDGGSETHWPLVVGWEFGSWSALVGGAPRALLLLDPRWPAPWGTAHNARLELRASARRSARPSAHPEQRLTYRGLDEQVMSVRLAGFLAFRGPRQKEVRSRSVPRERPGQSVGERCFW